MRKLISRASGSISTVRATLPLTRSTALYQGSVIEHAPAGKQFGIGFPAYFEVPADWIASSGCWRCPGPCPSAMQPDIRTSVSQTCVSKTHLRSATTVRPSGPAATPP